jgi:hypothetical protein
MAGLVQLHYPRTWTMVWVFLSLWAGSGQHHTLPTPRSITSVPFNIVGSNHCSGHSLFPVQFSP